MRPARAKPVTLQHTNIVQREWPLEFDIHTLSQLSTAFAFDNVQKENLLVHKQFPENT